MTYYLLDNEYYFKRDSVYGDFDDGERFAFFSKAALEMLCHIDFTPDILHCNDWQSAMVILNRKLFYQGVEKLREVKTVFTIHNIQMCIRDRSKTASWRGAHRCGSGWRRGCRPR